MTCMGGWQVKCMGGWQWFVWEGGSGLYGRVRTGAAELRGVLAKRVAAQQEDDGLTLLGRDVEPEKAKEAATVVERVHD